MRGVFLALVACAAAFGQAPLSQGQIGGGGATPGGSSGDIQYNNAGLLSGAPIANCVAAGGVLQYTSGTHTFSCHTLASADIPAVAWSTFTAPAAALSLSMGANATTFTFSSATGAINGFKFTDTASNTGTGILHYITTANSSAMTPWQADSNGCGWKVASDGSFQNVGCGTSGSLDFTAYLFANLGTPSNGRLLFCSDCTVANPCAGSGTGAFAKRLNGAWVCN